MGDWTDLQRLGREWTLRPVSSPELFPRAGHRGSQFRASFGATVKLLRFELEKLGARQVVIELAIREDELRLDGLPRAHASVDHSGVILSFESRHGPLRYATSEFTSWSENLRAIALGLEALRAVDRYGISRRGEQYRGYRQIEAVAGPGLGQLERGRELIEKHGSVREALMATHPDRGGDAGDFAAVQAAREEGS